MTEPSADQQNAVARVRQALGAQAPQHANAAQIDRAVLRAHGLEELAVQLWREAGETSDRAAAEVTRRIRAEYGVRSPRGGLLPIAVLILTFAGAAPIGFLNAIRLGSPGGLTVAAVLTVVLGLAALGLSFAAGMRPVAGPTALQSKISAFVMLLAGGIGIAVAADPVADALFAVGAVGAIGAAAIYAFGRSRDRAATERIDSAEARIRAEVAPQVDQDRARLRDELAARLSGRDDVDAMRSMRSLAIAAFRDQGGKTEDADPGALPGGYIIRDNTTRWLPLTERGLWPPAGS